MYYNNAIRLALQNESVSVADSLAKSIWPEVRRRLVVHIRLRNRIAQIFVTAQKFNRGRLGGTGFNSTRLGGWWSDGGIGAGCGVWLAGPTDRHDKLFF